MQARTTELLARATQMALLVAACAGLGCRTEAGKTTTPVEPVEPQAAATGMPPPLASAPPSASAPEPPTPPASARASEPQSTSVAPPAVFGETDEARRRTLASSTITEVVLARGGRSVSFKLTLQDGSQGLYKPEQSFAANWYSELASYALDRLLGLGRVPPAIGRRLPWATLEPRARQSKHADEVVVQRDGSVRGALSWWVSGDLVPLSPPDGWETWLRNEPPIGPSPYRRREDYQRAKKVAHEATFPERVPPPDVPDRIAELSDLILFDFLTANHDRWGGEFTNVRTLGKKGPLLAIDNANGFPRAGGTDAHALAKLEWLQRFRGRTVRALEHLELSAFEAALGQDPLAPLLNQTQLEHFERRRQRALAHIRDMQTRFGASALPW